MPPLFELDLSRPIAFLALTLFMFLVITLRYFAIAGLFYLLFHKVFKKKFVHREVEHRHYPKDQFQKEISYSMITALIFAIIGALTTIAWQKGYTAFYVDIDEYGYTYLIVSLFILMAIHETYYYWLHRLMHHPKLFSYVHKVHHQSHIPSPWTAFSFHPFEGVLEGLILPIMLFIIPVHYATLLIYLTIMTISSVINHLNIELYPSSKGIYKWTKWIIGASHHSLHHSEYRYNFGLYFTFWDKLAKTESPRFKSLFDSKTN